MPNRYICISLLVLFVAVAFFSAAVSAQQIGGSNASVIAAMGRGDLKGALAILDKAIANKSDLLESYKMRSLVRSMSGDLAGGLDDLTSAIEIRHDDADLYQRRAMARMNLNQDTKLILKDLDSAIVYGKKLDKVYSLRAMVRRNAGNENGAIEDYHSAIALRPANAGAHIGLATIFLLRGENEKGIALLENFLTGYENLESDIGKSYDTSSVVGNTVVIGSIVALPRPSQSGQMESLITQSNMNRTMPSTPDEMEKITQGLEDTKNTALAYVTLASAYAKRSDYDRALVTVEKAMKIDNTDFFAFETRGVIRVGLGDYQNAIGDLTISIDRFTKSGRPYLERGIAYLATGKDDAAQKDFAKYLELYPNGKETLARRIDEIKQKIVK